jgi:hypothetical protein
LICIIFTSGFNGKIQTILSNNFIVSKIDFFNSHWQKTKIFLIFTGNLFF